MKPFGCCRHLLGVAKQADEIAGREVERRVIAHHDLDADRLRPGADHRDRLRMAELGDEEARPLGAAERVAHVHRPGGGGGPVEPRGVGHRPAGGVGDRLCALEERDVSGNRKFGDVGVMLRDGIAKYFKDRKVPVSLKYIDPSYIIRSSSAIPSDSIFCNQLAQNAAHAGMAGKTGMLVGIWNNCFTHVPIDIAIRNRKFIDPESMFWLNVLETTGQPRWMQNKPRTA